MKTIILLIALAFVNAASQVPTVADKDAPSKITIAGPQEPGERLTVTGRVRAEDGVTPLAGASVYVYHTDVNGYYSPGTNDSRNPRLRGYLRTDAQGRYEFNTIKPGSYPNSRVPAHIHYVVSAAGYKDRVFEIVFEGDPFLTDNVRQEAAKAFSGFALRRLEKDSQGRWRCTQDIKLQPNRL
jgi:protocatechuate 3,4-dioxygenase beta subunit